MKQDNDLNKIKEKIKIMEDEIIKERKERNLKIGSLFSYRLFEIKVKKYREEEAELTEQGQKEIYRERLKEVIKQHRINMEDVLDVNLCLKAVMAIHNANNLLYDLE